MSRCDKVKIITLLDDSTDTFHRAAGLTHAMLPLCLGRLALSHISTAGFCGILTFYVGDLALACHS